MVSAVGFRPAPERVVVERLRDLLAHRGPSAAGYAESAAGHVRFGHRRLAVLDPSPQGAQPWTGPDRSLLVYNGELYNDAELRRDLTAAGGPDRPAFRSSCDTETLFESLRQWGVGAITKLRGMFAFAWYDAGRERLILARDPLGIKPLYWAKFNRGGVSEIAFSSEIRPLLEHPLLSVAPDLVTVSSYLTTIRTTLGRRTLFAGVNAVMPGEVIEFDLRNPALPPESAVLELEAWDQAPALASLLGESDHAVKTREIIADSVQRHLRSDVPLCSLLSGGLDSTVIASLLVARGGTLRTYAAGAAEPHEPTEPDRFSSDLAWAREVSRRFQTIHEEATITRKRFHESWVDLVGSAAVPLSTPNEVAIHEVARRLSRGGHVVALSGEGADELFGGYEHPLDNASRAVAADAEAGLEHDGGGWQLRDAAWVPPDMKPALLNQHAWRLAGEDSESWTEYRSQFRRCLASVCEASALNADSPGRVQAPIDGRDILLAAHLQFSRRINLAGLLLRLDSATMRCGVEGRTPFADVAVARFAESLPISARFCASAPAGPARTKISLRRAFAATVPDSVLSRPKASFPLPFQEWIADSPRELFESDFAREIFSAPARQMVAQKPSELWRLAWPMLNLAMWGRRW